MARITCNPMPWGTTAFEQVLDEVADAGLQGVELHDAAIQAFARQPGRLRSLLDQRALAASGAPFVGTYVERDERKDETERLRRLADFLSEVATDGVIVFRTAAHPGRRDVIAGERPLLPLSASRMALLCDVLNQYCDVCRDFGLVGAIQNRVGTFVETADEYQAIIEQTEPELVWLAPDLGHWTYIGSDPVKLIATHRYRLACPRLKDFDRPAFDLVREEHLGFHSFVRGGGLPDLGEGSAPLADALMPLVKSDYGGWLCLDVEWSTRSPKESATWNRDFLREHLHW